MKIAVTARGKTLADQVDPRFGRCQYFLVVDTDTLNTEPIENPNVALGGGAGIQSAQLMAEHDVKVVLTGNCGPNAHQTLSAADIEVVVGVSGTVREAVKQFTSGALASTQKPNVASHFGMAAEASVSIPRSARAEDSASPNARGTL
jgi:predicted Fe-Mo cluster-binding NifX family protein